MYAGQNVNVPNNVCHYVSVFVIFYTRINLNDGFQLDLGDPTWTFLTVKKYLALLLKHRD